MNPYKLRESIQDRLHLLNDLRLDFNKDICLNLTSEIGMYCDELILQIEDLQRENEHLQEELDEAEDLIPEMRK